MANHEPASRCMSIAIKLVEFARAAKPWCDQCEKVEPQGHSSCPPGFEVDALACVYRRRCAKCANTLSYPWAREVDVERLADALEKDPHRFEGYELSVLEEFVVKRSGGFEFL